MRISDWSSDVCSSDLGPAAVSCGDGFAQAALLFPLAHTATLRVVLPLSAGGLAEPAAYPAATQVASGWATHAAGGARTAVPDRRRSEERRVGKGCVIQCRSRWSTSHKKTQKKQ